MKTINTTVKKTVKHLLLFCYLVAISPCVIAQITPGNCYKINIGISYLDYNPTIDANYVYGRAASTDPKTSQFKLEVAPAPNTSFYTIKTYDGKYLTRESSSNKIKVKQSFDEIDNQVFKIETTTIGLYIWAKNTSFGTSAMQWSNNEVAYIFGKNGSYISRYVAVTCTTVTNDNGNNGNNNSISSWPTASIGTDNIINPNKGGVITGSGITSAPAGYKLFVEEGILTEKFVVTPKASINWADFVFEKNYPLMKLSEVKKYIEANRHLPDILSAEEIAKQGINITDNLIKQLQKIEELTLHLIRQEEELGKITRRLKALEKTPQKLFIKQN